MLLKTIEFGQPKEQVFNTMKEAYAALWAALSRPFTESGGVYGPKGDCQVYINTSLLALQNRRQQILQQWEYDCQTPLESALGEVARHGTHISGGNNDQ